MDGYAAAKQAYAKSPDGVPLAPAPAFHTLYLEEPDGQGHAHGPHSPEVATAVRTLDATLGRLRKNMGESVWDATNIVIVADHGMADIAHDRVVYLADDCGRGGFENKHSTDATLNRHTESARLYEHSP